MDDINNTLKFINVISRLKKISLDSSEQGFVTKCALLFLLKPYLKTINIERSIKMLLSKVMIHPESQEVMQELQEEFSKDTNFAQCLSSIEELYQLKLESEEKNSEEAKFVNSIEQLQSLFISKKKKDKKDKDKKHKDKDED